MMKKIYLSHPYQGKEENREKAAALAEFYNAVWAAEGKDYELIDPISYFAPLSEDGVDDETILMMAVALMMDCDGVLFAPGWKKSRGCRYEHWRARHAEEGTRVKYFQAEIPEEVEEAAVHWYGKHHITTRRWAA
jgi:hypothetical protein